MVIRGLRVDREQLRRIVAEELARALADAGSGAVRAGIGGAREGRGAGLIVFSGPQAPGESFSVAVSALRAEGWRLEAMVSLTFRAMSMAGAGSTLAGLEIAGNADDEAASAARLGRAHWLLFADLSENALAKAVYGIADSIPTQALAQALGSGKPCLLLETREAPSAVIGLARLEKLRRLERRGAVIASPRDCLTALHTAMAAAAGWGFVGGPDGAGKSRQVITAEDVQEAARRGMARLTISASAIVTGRAQDEARALGIEIVRGGGGP
jgi:hypothetical protein